MRSVIDQQGNTVPWDKFLDRVAETILANMIAFDRAGFSPLDVQVLVGRDGTTVKAGRALVQIPVEGHLTDKEGRELFEVFERLHLQFCKGEIPTERVQRICEEHDVAKKAETLRKRKA